MTKATPESIVARAREAAPEALETLIRLSKRSGGRGQSVQLSAAIRVLEVAQLLKVDVPHARESEGGSAGLRLVLVDRGQALDELATRVDAERAKAGGK